MSAALVGYESAGQVALLTLNRPEKRNALNDAMCEALHRAWQRFAASDDRVAVLAAAGEAFCVGADLHAPPRDFAQAVPGIGIAVEKPIIAATAGWVIGGGLVLAIQADLLVAAETAKFSYPEAKVGISGGIAAGIVARIPHKIAMEVLLLGEVLSAGRAYEAGFANRVVPAGTERQAALEMAGKLAANAPLVVQLLKRFAGELVAKTAPERAAITRRELDAVRNSADAGEGVSAFREKRAPRFTGR